MAHGAGRRAAAARTRWPARGCADLTHPVAPLGRSGKHVAVVAATTHSMMSGITSFYPITTKIAWPCLLPPLRGRRSRSVRPRVPPGHLAAAPAARGCRCGLSLHHCLLWDDLTVGMDQGRQRGRARARPRPRTGARGLPLHSQRGPARLPPAPPTNARSLHFKRCGARRRRNRIRPASFGEL